MLLTSALCMNSLAASDEAQAHSITTGPDTVAAAVNTPAESSDNQLTEAEYKEQYSKMLGTLVKLTRIGALMEFYFLGSETEERTQQVATQYKERYHSILQKAENMPTYRERVKYIGDFIRKFEALIHQDNNPDSIAKDKLDPANDKDNDAIAESPIDLVAYIKSMIPGNTDDAAKGLEAGTEAAAAKDQITAEPQTEGMRTE